MYHGVKRKISIESVVNGGGGRAAASWRMTVTKAVAGVAASGEESGADSEKQSL